MSDLKHISNDKLDAMKSFVDTLIRLGITKKSDMIVIFDEVQHRSLDLISGEMRKEVEDYISESLTRLGR